MKYYLISIFLLSILFLLFLNDYLIENRMKQQIFQSEPKFDEVKEPIHFIGFRKEDKFYHDYLLFK